MRTGQGPGRQMGFLTSNALPHPSWRTPSLDPEPAVCSVLPGHQQHRGNHCPRGAVSTGIHEAWQAWVASRGVGRHATRSRLASEGSSGRPSDPRAEGAGGSCAAEGRLTPRPTRKHLTSETEPAGCSTRGWVAAQELRRRAGAGEGDHGSEGAGAGVAAKARAHGRGQPEAEGLDPPRG